MSTWTDTARTAAFVRGEFIVRMQNGRELRFPVADNPRLAGGPPTQLNHIEISPFGLHWPDLHEDLSFRGLLAGQHGQRTRPSESCVVREHHPQPKYLRTVESIPRVSPETRRNKRTPFAFNDERVSSNSELGDSAHTQ